MSAATEPATVRIATRVAADSHGAYQGTVRC